MERLCFCGAVFAATGQHSDLHPALLRNANLPACKASKPILKSAFITLKRSSSFFPSSQKSFAASSATPSSRFDIVCQTPPEQASFLSSQQQKSPLPKLNGTFDSTLSAEKSDKPEAISKEAKPFGGIKREKNAIVLNEYDYHYFRLPHLTDFVPDVPTYPTPLDSNYRLLVSHDTESPCYSFNGEFVEENTFVDLNIVHRPGQPDVQHAMVRAGPRRRIYFDPREVKAAIVTCGGLCPGMNVVIRELVMTLSQNYCVDEILGIQCGYRGFYSPDTPPIQLNPDKVRLIHSKGGTILRSSRGGFDLEKIMDMLQTNGINQLYVIGGDGTHKGASQIAEEAARRNLKIAVVGIPKTIDNDIPYIDKSFGFDTSVEEACKAIDSAYVESSCYPNGIGIVNLMGRHSGFIAMQASLASRLVDVCLIPEIPFQLYGEHGLFEYLHKRIKERGHAVVVTAEGAGQDLLPERGEFDASGNKKLAAIGRYLYEEARRHFPTVGVDASVKYIDPTYMIRSIPANATDALYCSFLAQNAVHGAFAGYTGFTAGRVNNMHVYLPMKAVTGGQRKVDPIGRYWFGLMYSTMQPDFYTVNKGDTVSDNKDERVDHQHTC
mmetsp:Transcript_40386/g.65487  ORF Transcript_40386/g.65487 Transcript_40386/m.65487 type:complete len:607 (-) Transcript_40386:58-1878(-)